jgi:DNA polymerase-1
MDLTNPAGEPSGAVFGFTNLLTSFLERENPEHIAVVFDCREPTFRHEMYPEYKANRAEFPEELVPQLPKIKQLLDMMGIPRMEKPGFEADDLIGTLAKEASKQGIDAICVTNDKDYYQLVDDHIQIMKPLNKGAGFDFISYDGVKEKFGVMPNQVIDVMALWGDASDNIPGVKGVGEKTAIPLIAEHGSLEGLYENIEKVERKAVKSKLEKDKENAFLSKKLVTIATDVPCEKSIEELAMQTPDYIALDDFFKEEGMSAARNKWYERGKDVLVDHRESEVVVEEKTETIEDIEKDYRLVNTVEQLDELITELKDVKDFAFDLETSSLDIYTCDIVGIAIATEPFKAWYIAVSAPKSAPSMDLFAQQDEETFTAIDPKVVAEKLKPIFENQEIGKFGQNIKFDAAILRRYGIVAAPLTFDTMLASFLLNSDDSHGLDALSQKYLNYTPIPITSLIGEKKKDQRSMADIDPAEIKDYACEDADLSLRLKLILEEKIEKENLKNLADTIEFPLINVLINMEQSGVSINQSALAELSKKLGERLAELTKLIFAEADAEFNIDSPKQLGTILFEKLGIPPTKKTKTGYSTDVSVLTTLSYEHKIAEYLLEYRTLQKLKSTYIDTLPKLVRKHSNRIHTTFNQHVAGTGRLSSTDPNLQNIPIRTDLGKEIRRAFVPKDKDHIIFAADYSQVELRVMAYMCEDEQMTKSFKEGLDIHSATAATLFDKTADEVDGDERRAAKTVNFGIMYGLGSFGLASRLDISRKRAKEIIDSYFEKFPFIKKYMDETISFAEEKGYAETLCGRRRFFPDIRSKNRQRRTGAERAAINMPIQGTAADMMKIAMIAIDKEMQEKQYKSKMILQVHDELVFDVYKPELDDIKELVAKHMTNAMSLGDIPLDVDMGTGESWFEAH